MAEIGITHKGIVDRVKDVKREWDQRYDASRRARIREDMRSGRTRMTSKPPSIFEGIMPKQGFLEGRRPNPVITGAVSEGIETVKNIADETADFVQEHTGELTNAGRAGLVGITLMGATDKLASSMVGAASSEPAHVRTEVHPGLREYVAANPVPATSYAPETPKTPAIPVSPLDVASLPAAAPDVPLPVFTSQRPDAPAAISESATAQEQYMVASQLPAVESSTPTIESTYTGPAAQAVESLPDVVDQPVPSVTDSRSAQVVEPLPDVVEPTVESVTGSQAKNDADLEAEKAEVVTGAEKFLASQLPTQPKEPPAPAPSANEQKPAVNLAEAQVKAKENIISQLLPNLPQAHADKLNAEVDEWIDPSEKNYASVLPQLIASYDAQISALSEQYNIPKFMFYAHMLVESNGRPTVASENSDAAGLFQFRPPAARESGLIVDLANGIDERLIPEKAMVAFAKYFTKNRNFLGGDLAFGMQGFKAGMGNARSYILLADPQKRPEWGAAARETNPFSVMQNPAVIEAINSRGDPDDFIYPAKIVAAAVQYELAAARTSR